MSVCRPTACWRSVSIVALHIHVLLFCSGAAPLPITITTDTLDGEPQRGQPATIVCRVQHAPLGTSIFWLKAASLPTSLHRHPGDDVTDMELIATNTTTTPLYRRIGRYTAQSHLLGDVAIFTLHISNIRGEDSGYFICAVKDDAWGFAEIVVKNIPHHFVVLGREGEDDHVSLVAGENNTLSVIVSHIRSIPKLSVKLNGRTCTHRFDVTHVVRHVRCPPQAVTKETNCPLHYDLDVNFNATSFYADERDDGGVLHVELRIADTDMPQAVLTVPVEVLYGPVVLCEMPQTSVTLGDTLLVTCKARFNPAPIATYWQFNVDDVLHKLHQGHTFKEFSARKQQISHEKKATFVLAIKQVKRHHLITAYEFVIRNDIGEQRTKFYLYGSTVDAVVAVGDRGQSLSSHSRSISSASSAYTNGLDLCVFLCYVLVLSLRCTI